MTIVTFVPAAAAASRMAWARSRALAPDPTRYSRPARVMIDTNPVHLTKTCWTSINGMNVFCDRPKGRHARSSIASAVTSHRKPYRRR